MPLSRGSLNFTNLRFFDLALKINWLKRVQYNDSGWAKLAHIFSIHKIVSFGDLFSKKLSENIQNRFWANVAYGAFKLLELSKPKNSLEFLNTPLWHNSHLRLQYRKEWLNKGYLCIRYIVDTEGDLFTRQQLREKGLKILFFKSQHTKSKNAGPAHGRRIPWPKNSKYSEHNRVINKGVCQHLQSIKLSRRERNTGCSAKIEF